MSTEPPQPVLNYASPGVTGPARTGRGVFGWVLFIGLVVMLFLMVKNTGSQYTPISFGQFMDELQKGHMSEITIERDGVKGTLTGSALRMPSGIMITRFRVSGPAGAESNWQFIEYVNRYRGMADVRFDLNNNVLLDILLPLIPWLLVFGFLWFFVFRALRKNQSAQPRPMPVYQVPAPVQQPTNTL